MSGDLQHDQLHFEHLESTRSRWQICLYQLPRTHAPGTRQCHPPSTLEPSARPHAYMPICYDQNVASDWLG
eukprot:9179728-Pyramimonas_sp.AAC.1